MSLRKQNEKNIKNNSTVYNFLPRNCKLIDYIAKLSFDKALDI